MRRLTWILLAALAAGCAGYKLGPTNGIAAGSRSISVRPFVNHTHDPRVTEYLATSFRRQFQQDGTFRLETGDAPDIVLQGEITHIERTGLSYLTNDVLTPQEYTLTLSAHVVAVLASTGKTNFDQIVHGRTYIWIGNDEFSAERQAIPLLTDDLARQAVERIVDGTW